jgi:DNA-binding GntR family transcriptional regulator
MTDSPGALLEQTTLPRTTEGVAASELRTAIVRGELAPGQKIRQEATAKQLGISLVPVREALKTLAAEGLLTYEPQRGYFVTELRDDAVRDIYAVRSLLESETERLAIGNLREQDLQTMRTQIRTQEIAATDHEAVEMIAANRRFHFTIFLRCSNQWLVRYVAQLWDTLDPLRVITYRRMWLDGQEQLIPDEVVGEHRRILTALEKRRYERALQLLAKHRQRSKRFVAIFGDGSAHEHLG